MGRSCPVSRDPPEDIAELSCITGVASQSSIFHVQCGKCNAVACMYRAGTVAMKFPRR